MSELNYEMPISDTEWCIKAIRAQGMSFTAPNDTEEHAPYVRPITPEQRERFEYDASAPPAARLYGYIGRALLNDMRYKEAQDNSRQQHADKTTGPTPEHFDRLILANQSSCIIAMVNYGEQYSGELDVSAIFDKANADLQSLPVMANIAAHD
jgi:hypothetical protein